MHGIIKIIFIAGTTLQNLTGWIFEKPEIETTIIQDPTEYKFNMSAVKRRRSHLGKSKI